MKDAGTGETAQRRSGICKYRPISAVGSFTAKDFRHIYDIVEDLYCEDNGYPSVDPIVLFKIVLIQYLYGIPLQEINMNIAYRRFIGYALNEELPHFSTVSYNFILVSVHRGNRGAGVFLDFAGSKWRRISGTEAVFVDGTHIKANVNIKKKIKQAVPRRQVLRGGIDERG